jgi:hypothetical protein
MKSEPLPTLSAKVTSEKRTNNIILFTLVILLGISLAGIITVITTAHIRTDANSNGNTTQLSSNTVANAPSVSIRRSGRDYGAIYGTIDPGASLAADPMAATPALGLGHDYGAIYGTIDPCANLSADPVAAFPPIGPGHDYGAIYGTIDPGANLSAEPAVAVLPALGPGRDFGAIYGAIDPGKNRCVQQPKLSYTFNGITVVRRSELGPLTNTIDNCSQTSVP